METETPNSQPVTFRYLNAEEIKNPILVIEDFFDNTYVELFRQDLRLLFTLASTNEDYIKSKNYSTSSLIITHQQVIEFLEAVYILLNDKSINLKIDPESPLFQTKGNWDEYYLSLELRMENNIMKHCRLLEDKEINNVKKVFKKIFKLQDLEEWRAQLDTILYYSLSSTPSSDECYNGQLLFPMHELLEKLLEAIHIINEIKHPDHIEITDSIFKESIKKDGPLHTEQPEQNSSQKSHPESKEPEEEGNDYTSHPEILLSAKLQKAIVSHLEEFEPKQISINLRKLFFGYLNNAITEGQITMEEDEEFQYQLSQLFKILDLAEEEATQWPKAGRMYYYQ